jgi:hypothetical protein
MITHYDLEAHRYVREGIRLDDRPRPDLGQARRAERLHPVPPQLKRAVAFCEKKALEMLSN